MADRVTPHPLDIVFRRGARLSRPAFTVYYKEIAQNLRPRIVIGSKVDKRATARNRIRRRISAVVRPFMRPRLGLVVVCRPEIKELTAVELRSQLTTVLKRI